MLYIFLKFILFSIIGFYIFKIFGVKDNYFYGIISPGYAIIALPIILGFTNNIILLYILGIVIGIITDCIFNLINPSMRIGLNPCIYGLLNIFNSYVLNTLIGRFITASSYESITFLFIITSILFILDISLSLRKSI